MKRILHKVSMSFLCGYSRCIVITLANNDDQDIGSDGLLEKVDKFCCLGDTSDADGGCFSVCVYFRPFCSWSSCWTLLTLQEQCCSPKVLSTLITQPRSVVKNVGCFLRRLFVCGFACVFVCQHDNFRTRKHRR